MYWRGVRRHSLCIMLQWISWVGRVLGSRVKSKMDSIRVLNDEPLKLHVPGKRGFNSLSRILSIQLFLEVRERCCWSTKSSRFWAVEALYVATWSNFCSFKDTSELKGQLPRPTSCKTSKTSRTMMTEEIHWIGILMFLLNFEILDGISPLNNLQSLENSSFLLTWVPAATTFRD